MGRHLLGPTLEQPAELALVRREHGRRLALPEQLEPPGVGVQAVGVDQQRRLHGRAPRRARTPGRPRRGRGPGRARPRRRARPSPPRPPRRPACGSRRRPEARGSSPRAGAGRPPAAPEPARPPARSRRPAREPSARPSSARPSARPSRRRPPRRRSRTSSRCGVAARIEVEHALARSGRPRSAPGAPRGMPISTTSTSPGVLLAGVHVEPDLRAVEGRGHGRPHGLALDLAGRRVHARRHVAGHHRRVLPVDRPDRGRDGSRGAPSKPVPSRASTTTPASRSARRLGGRRRRRG